MHARAWSPGLRLDKLEAQALGPLKLWTRLQGPRLGLGFSGLWAWACTSLTPQYSHGHNFHKKNGHDAGTDMNWRQKTKRGEVDAKNAIRDAEMIHISGAVTAWEMWEQLTMVKESRGWLGVQLQTNKVNKFIDRFIGPGRDFLKVWKPSE